MKYAVRIIAFPFMSIVALIGALKMWIEFSINFIRYGGEAIQFTKDHKPTTMADVMNYLKTKLD